MVFTMLLTAARCVENQQVMILAALSIAAVIFPARVLMAAPMGLVMRHPLTAVAWGMVGAAVGAGVAVEGATSARRSAVWISA